MSTIKQLLRLHLQGVSNRKISEQIGIYKGTVNRYIQKLKLLEQSIDDLLKLEEPVLAKLFSAGWIFRRDSASCFGQTVPL